MLDVTGSFVSISFTHNAHTHAYARVVGASHVLVICGLVITESQISLKSYITYHLNRFLAFMPAVARLPASGC